jgi:hypothetical protein
MEERAGEHAQTLYVRDLRRTTDQADFLNSDRAIWAYLSRLS